jgi:hypothetical protein
MKTFMRIVLVCSLGYFLSACVAMTPSAEIHARGGYTAPHYSRPYVRHHPYVYPYMRLHIVIPGLILMF